MINERYEKIRRERVSRAEQTGNYYRKLSLHYNGEYENIPTLRPLDLLSDYGQALIARALSQGPLNKNKDCFIKLLCRFCNRTFIINDVDQHERECDKHT